MKEKEVEVKTYKIRAYCECGGEYTYAGISYPTYPEQHVHHCSKCNNKEKSFNCYPYIKHLEINHDT